MSNECCIKYIYGYDKLTGMIDVVPASIKNGTIAEICVDYNDYEEIISVIYKDGNFYYEIGIKDDINKITSPFGEVPFKSEQEIFNRISYIVEKEKGGKIVDSDIAIRDFLETYKRESDGEYIGICKGGELIGFLEDVDNKIEEIKITGFWKAECINSKLKIHKLTRNIKKYSGVDYTVKLINNKELSDKEERVISFKHNADGVTDLLGKIKQLGGESNK